MPQNPYQLNRSTYDRIAPQFAQVYGSMTPDLVAAACLVLHRPDRITRPI